MTRQHSIKSHVAASPPPPARSPPPPAAAYVSVQNHANKPPSLLRTMAEGIAFGTGSSLAREAVGQALGSSSSKNKNEIIDPEEVYKTKTKTKCEEMLHDLDSCFHSQFACDDILQKYLAVCVSSSKTSGVRTDNVVSTMDIPTDKYASHFI